MRVRVCVQSLKFDEMLIAKYVTFSIADLQFAVALFNVHFVKFLEKIAVEVPLAMVQCLVKCTKFDDFMEFLIFVHFKNFFFGDCTEFGKHKILYDVFVVSVPNFVKSQVKPQVLGASMYKRTSK